MKKILFITMICTLAFATGCSDNTKTISTAETTELTVTTVAETTSVTLGTSETADHSLDMSQGVHTNGVPYTDIIDFNVLDEVKSSDTFEKTMATKGMYAFDKEAIMNKVEEYLGLTNPVIDGDTNTYTNVTRRYDNGVVMTYSADSKLYIRKDAVNE